MKYWLICAFLITHISFKADEVVVYATESIPYHYIDPDTGKIAGEDADYVAELFRRANIPVRFEVFNWKRALRSLESKQDSFIFPLTRTPDREDKYLWIAPVRTIEFAIFGTRELTKDAGKSNDKIYCVEGTYHCDVINRFDIPNCEIVTITPDSGGKLIELAAKGRIDFFISEVDKAELYIEAFDQPGKDILEVTTARLSYSDYLATSLDTSTSLITKLRDELNSGANRH